MVYKNYRISLGTTKNWIIFYIKHKIIKRCVTKLNKMLHINKGLFYYMCNKKIKNFHKSSAIMNISQLLQEKSVVSSKLKNLFMEQ